MEERRSFVQWVKCPIEFSKEFNYVRFRSRSELEIYKYIGFSRLCKENRYSNDSFVILHFSKVLSDGKNGIRISEHKEEFWPGWYNNAEHLKEEQVKKIFKIK